MQIKFVLPMKFYDRLLLAPEEFFSLSSTQEFVFSSLNTSNSLQHITAMSDWFYCYYFGFLFDNLIVLTLIMQEKENPICAYQNLDQQIELIKNELIRYLLLADCGDAVFEDQVDVFAEEINKFIEEKIKC